MLLKTQILIIPKEDSETAAQFEKLGIKYDLNNTRYDFLPILLNLGNNYEHLVSAEPCYFQDDEYTLLELATIENDIVLNCTFDEFCKLLNL